MATTAQIRRCCSEPSSTASSTARPGHRGSLGLSRARRGGVMGIPTAGIPGVGAGASLEPLKSPSPAKPRDEPALLRKWRAFGRRSTGVGSPGCWPARLRSRCRRAPVSLALVRESGRETERTAALAGSGRYGHRGITVHGQYSPNGWSVSTDALYRCKAQGPRGPRRQGRALHVQYAGGERPQVGLVPIVPRCCRAPGSDPGPTWSNRTAARCGTLRPYGLNCGRTTRSRAADT